MAIDFNSSSKSFIKLGTGIATIIKKIKTGNKKVTFRIRVYN